MDEPCTVTIEYGSYKWVAVVQADNETFLVKEYSGPNTQPFNTYAIHEDKLDEQISKVLEGSMNITEVIERARKAQQVQELHASHYPLQLSFDVVNPDWRDEDATSRTGATLDHKPQEDLGNPIKSS